MKREDFKIVQKFYATSSLIMIFYQDIIIESVEIYKNYKTVEDEASEKGKPAKLKTMKEKRTTQEISAECEKLIANYIKAN